MDLDKEWLKFLNASRGRKVVNVRQTYNWYMFLLVLKKIGIHLPHEVVLMILNNVVDACHVCYECKIKASIDDCYWTGYRHVFCSVKCYTRYYSNSSNSIRVYNDE